jgi:hypothetical protein
MLTGVCLVSGCVAVFIANEIEETEPVTLVDTKLTIDTSTLPEDPKEKDWYPIAVRVLESSAWNLPPNLVMFGTNVPCSVPTGLTRLHLGFEAVDFVGVVPHRKVAVVDLDRSTDSASVRIYDAGPSLTPLQTLQFSRMLVDSHEALAIADRYGGREFRESVNNNCEVSLWIRDYEWGINYKESGQSTRPELRIRIDAKSGKAKRLPR